MCFVFVSGVAHSGSHLLYRVVSAGVPIAHLAPFTVITILLTLFTVLLFASRQKCLCFLLCDVLLPPRSDLSFCYSDTESHFLSPSLLLSGLRQAQS